MRGSLVASLLVVLAAAPRAHAGDERRAIAFETGRFDAFRGGEVAAQAGISARTPLALGFEGEAGLVFADASIAFVHAGLARELALFSSLYLRPALGLVAYHGGAGKRLGTALEFRSGIELGWTFPEGWRAGVALYHLSNAALADRNPGEESLVLTFTLPVRALRPSAPGRPR